jgi:hypothetical protein
MMATGAAEQALERLVLTQAHPASTFSTVPRSADIIHLVFHLCA